MKNANASLLSAAVRSPPPLDACEQIVGGPIPRPGTVEWVRLTFAAMRERPIELLKLLPLLLVALFLPALVLPSFGPAPEPPEPRGPLEAGDVGDADDLAGGTEVQRDEDCSDVGCVTAR